MNTGQEELCERVLTVCQLPLAAKTMYKLMFWALCARLQASSVLSTDRPVVSAPRQVRFHSVNLKNTVLWNPGKRTLPGTTYTVEYSIYGDASVVDDMVHVNWRSVPHCSSVIATECDVTNQTDDMEEEYYVRVRANRPQMHSIWTETGVRFNPMMDTILGAPRLTLLVEDNYLHVKLRGPFRWRSSETKQSMLKIIPSIVYNVTVNNKISNTMEEYFPVENELLKLGPLEYSSEYCVMAEALSRSLPLTSRQSNWSCITIPEDPELKWIRILLLGIVIPSAVFVFVLAAVGGFAYYYIWGYKQKLPKSTDLVHIEEKLQTLQPEKLLTIINVNLINANLSAKEPKLSPFSSLHHHISEETPLLPPAVPHQPPADVQVLSYAAQRQDPHLQQVPYSGSSNPQQDSLSDEYGFVLQEENVPAPINTPTVSQYRVQQDLAREAGKQSSKEQITEEEEEEEGGEEEVSTFLNWDPKTGVLKIPLFCQFDPEETTETEPDVKVDTSLLLSHPVLTSVVFRQASEDSGEEDAFTKMEKDWGLRISCSPE